MAHPDIIEGMIESQLFVCINVAPYLQQQQKLHNPQFGQTYLTKLTRKLQRKCPKSYPNFKRKISANKILNYKKAPKKCNNICLQQKLHKVHSRFDSSNKNFTLPLVTQLHLFVALGSTHKYVSTPYLVILYTNI